jgi:NADH-quinone oxidoreductase subunit H
MMTNKKKYITIHTMMLISGNLFYEIYNFILSFLDVLTIFIGILLCVAFYTLAERKFMGSVQRRLGPNVVGFMGMLQAFADALKLLLKELVIPYRANRMLFVFAPFMFLTLALLGWAVVPLAIDVLIADILYGLLFIYLVSSLSVFGVIIAGWASNSKYPFLGALRSAAQMISYEVSMGFILIIISILTGTFNLTDIVLSQQDVWFIFLLFPLFLMFLVSILAETNRAPFDLPEAEAELVAGYNLEYSGIMFAMFFLAEYSNMLLMSILTIHLFLGGWFSVPLNTDILNLLADDIISYFLVYIINIFIGLKLYISYCIPEIFSKLIYIYEFVTDGVIKFKFILKGRVDTFGNFENLFIHYTAYNQLDDTQTFSYGYYNNLKFFLDSYYLNPFVESKILESYVSKNDPIVIDTLYQIKSINFNYSLLDKSFIFTGIKLIILSVFFVLTRAALPRYRYDQLMYIGWKSFLPFTIGYMVFIIGICYFFGLFPDTQGNPFFNFYTP